MLSIARLVEFLAAFGPLSNLLSSKPRAQTAGIEEFGEPVPIIMLKNDPIPAYVVYTSDYKPEALLNASIWCSPCFSVVSCAWFAQVSILVVGTIIVSYPAHSTLPHSSLV